MFNRDPVDHMIEYLTINFPEDLPNDCKRSLAIRAGSKGKEITEFSMNKNCSDESIQEVMSLCVTIIDNRKIDFQLVFISKNIWSPFSWGRREVNRNEIQPERNSTKTDFH